MSVKQETKQLFTKCVSLKMMMKSRRHFVKRVNCDCSHSNLSKIFETMDIGKLKARRYKIVTASEPSLYPRQSINKCGLKTEIKIGN